MHLHRRELAAHTKWVIRVALHCIALYCIALHCIAADMKWVIRVARRLQLPSGDASNQTPRVLTNLFICSLLSSHCISLSTQSLPPSQLAWQVANQTPRVLTNFFLICIALSSHSIASHCSHLHRQRQ